LMLAALEYPDPVIYLEHKLLADYWLDFLGSGGRKTVHYDVPAAGAAGPVALPWQPVAIGKAVERRAGEDLTIVSVGVGAHRALEAAAELEKQGISTGVIDLRTVAPLDREIVCQAVAQTGRMLVVDEDYTNFGLSGELAALVLEAGINCRYARVGCDETIPYARPLEDQVLPNVTRIVRAGRDLCG
jgi:pyruvate/2-oxoglutarate/acetoin dehydrogenase E1 component